MVNILNLKKGILYRRRRKVKENAEMCANQNISESLPDKIDERHTEQDELKRLANEVVDNFLVKTFWVIHGYDTRKKVLKIEIKEITEKYICYETTPENHKTSEESRSQYYYWYEEKYQKLWPRIIELARETGIEVEPILEKECRYIFKLVLL